MKRILCLILALTFLVLFPGCGQEEDPAIRFYYLRSEYIYGTEDGVIAPEEREIVVKDMGYLLELYLDGPQTESLVSPFPKGTHLISTHMQDGTLTLELSREFAVLDDVKLSLAAGCIASTCFDLSDAVSVQILAYAGKKEVSITLKRDSLTLIDNSILNTPTEDPSGQ